MKIAIITTLNDNLVKAKLIPLINIDKVNEIYFITDFKGPNLPKVTYFIPSKLLYVICIHKFFAKFILLLWISFKKDPDLIMAYNILPHGYSAFIVAKFLGKRVYQHLIGGFCDIKSEFKNSDNSVVKKINFLGKLFTELNKYVAKNSDLVFVPGNSTQLKLVEELMIPDNKIIQLHSTIDTDYFKPSENELKFDVLVVSSLEVRKRIDLLLEVIVLVKKEIPNIKVAILGAGSLENKLINLAKKLGVSENVAFMGFHQNIKKFYSKSKIFVLTSNFEGLSCAAMEAMSSGLPIVVPHVGDMEEIAHNNITGYLIEEINNAQAYADKITKLLKDAKLRKEFSLNAINLIKEQYSIESAVYKWRAIL